MDLDELRALLAVADTGSLLGASDRLRLTRSTLRRRLESLESRVGAPLLLRSPSGASLTPAGVEAATHARVILDGAASLLASARAAGDEANALLRVILPVGLPPVALVHIFQNLRAAWPGLRFDLHHRDDPLAAGLEGADLVFHFGDRVTSGPWVTRVVHPMIERAVASPALLAAEGVPTSVDDLRRFPLLSWRRPGADPERWPLRDGGSITVEPRLTSADVYALRHAARAGAGIALVPEGRIPDPDEPEGTLIEVLPDLLGRDCPLRMLTPTGVVRSPGVRRVLTALHEFLDLVSDPPEA